ncbi:protein tumorous imaginal discs, mitochondrial-like isoform X1 [Schistocerca gregaria]|uniref:protein tumorous imaginal discs, mitochondrial-like isoform X1 n=1 Tax=Schistocerca gregaria TaxID=7010 RepID=UPI00211E87EB|nr:protein tumorous imaginal discs, mitochondrial-like isoform X1 [Schistocerca gregaria]
MAAARGLINLICIRSANFSGLQLLHPFQCRFILTCAGCGRKYGEGLLSLRVVQQPTKFVPVLQSAVSRDIHTSSVLKQKKDYYEILGVPRNASAREIKAAYYKLAKRYHPDTNKTDPDAGKKFHEVSEAYEVLSDDTKRKQYDSWGATSEQMGMGGAGASGRQGFEQHWNFHSTIDPEELFRKIFGQAGFNTSAFGGEEDFAESQFGFGAAREITLDLTFAQAARGVNKEVVLNMVDTCPKCHGSRAEPGTKAAKCSYCNGTGMETITTGPFVMRSTCRYCHGTRMHIKFPCTECEGKGSTVQRKRITVPVPAGVEHGQTVRMNVGNKELFITFRVEKSDYFRRDGADVHTDATISLAQAVLGGTVRVQGVYEDHTIQIPPGSSSHTRIRLSGKGLKKMNTFGGYGDHYVHIKIGIPKKLNDRQKALLLAYAELEEDTPGTVRGLTYKNDGKKEYTLEPHRILLLIRMALEGKNPVNHTSEVSKQNQRKPRTDDEGKESSDSNSRSTEEPKKKLGAQR